MLLDQIAANPLKSRFYLERYVNDGSPSGFSDLYRTSKNTDPYELKPWFNLYRCLAPDNWFVEYGNFPEYIFDNSENKFLFIHPDLVKDDRLKNNKLIIELDDSIRVTPTGSSRTVQIISNEAPYYIKLHYEGILGRVNRALPFHKAVSGVEITDELKNAIKNNILPKEFYILPEIGVRCLELPDLPSEKGIGMICRSNIPYGRKFEKINHIWPLFSLFSTDRLSPLDEYLLTQLINCSEMKPEEFILNKLIFPIIDCYFSLIFNLGYQIECNSQNIMIGLDERFSTISIIIRDIMRFEKDITIRQNLNLPVDYQSAPYKFIEASNELYQTRHSFSFDFKMTHYVILPIIDIVSSEFNIDRKKTESSIREFVRKQLKNLPDNFFPENCLWYKHERILLTDKRPYIACENPLFR